MKTKFLFTLGILLTVASLILCFLNPQGGGLTSLIYILLSFGGLLAIFLGRTAMENKRFQMIGMVFGTFFILLGLLCILNTLLKSPLLPIGRNINVIGITGIAGTLLFGLRRPPKKKEKK
ncbi:hypothetical protein [Lactococcus cremoris]|uniref:hypothetical protein n=1 Tax=Lactococcus lactis subsp. cremoris TaxID=1359 RepID=UPI000BDF3225|nr:hypothetical protein [Lactococcus cremoris]